MQPKNKPYSVRRRVILALSWSAVLVCMGVIFALSHETAGQSSEKSNGLIAFLLSRFGISVSSHVIRKTAHALEFCGLSALFYHAYFQSFRVPQPLLTLLSAVLYAATDEIHQYFVEGRACQLRDVFVDLIGAAAGVLACSILYFMIHKILQKREV